MRSDQILSLRVAQGAYLVNVAEDEFAEARKGSAGQTLMNTFEKRLEKKVIGDAYAVR